VKRGEIYWIDLGQPMGSEQGGKRPVLIVQNDIANQTSPTTIVAPITAAIQDKKYPVNVEITQQESGLSKDSTILLANIRTVNQNKLKNRVTCLSQIKMSEVDIALKRSLGLT
jgi:mRNA interferase MazF